MEFLREKLGDKYDEFVELIGDTKLIQDDGKYIPKARFDEVNEKLKQANKKLEEMAKAKMTDEEKLQALMEETNAAKQQYMKEMARLRAKEILVEGGLTEKDYSGLLDGIVTDNEETTTALAKNLVKLLQSKKTETEKRVREELLKTTPQPPAGATQPITKEEFQNMTYEQRAELYQQNRELFEKLNQ